MLQDAGSRWTLRSTTCLGLTALACLIAYAVYELRVGRVEYLLWSCNVATLLVAIGLLFRLPTFNAIGFLWLVIGLPMWVLDMLTGVGCHIFSVFTHVGGLLLGLAGTRQLGLPRGAWWQALAALYLLHVVSRWLTPEDENINLAFRIWQGWEGYFPSHRVYILLLMAGTAVLFATVQFALRASGFARQLQEGTA